MKCEGDLKNKGGWDAENAFMTSYYCPLYFSFNWDAGIGRRGGKRQNPGQWSTFFFAGELFRLVQTAFFSGSHNYIMMLCQVQMNSYKSLNPLYFIFLSLSQFFVQLYSYLLVVICTGCLCESCVC